MVVAEAMVVGAVAGAIGVGLAGVAAVVLDRVAANRLSGIPYLPDSLFRMEPWLIAGGLAIAIAAAVLGALPAVRRAAARDPASTLTRS
jgi:ABC-type antimicrobial peptide transport system permease subunit